VTARALDVVGVAAGVDCSSIMMLLVCRCPPNVMPSDVAPGDTHGAGQAVAAGSVTSTKAVESGGRTGGVPAM
jgi:hypothetical protein